MKILHITPSYSPAFVYGGPTFSVTQLCETTADTPLELTVFSTTANGLQELPTILKPAKVNMSKPLVFYFPRITKDHSHLSPRLLWHLFKSIKKYELFHIHSWWNLVAMPSVLLILLSGKKPIVSIRGMLSDYTLKTSKAKQLFHRFIGKLLLRNCILHVTSEKEKAECKAVLGQFNGFILPNFISLPPKDFTKKIKPNNVFHFSTLSRIHPVKNLEMVFNCLAELKLEWKLQIIGTGDSVYEEQLKKMTMTLNIASKIKWHGHLGGQQKYQVLANSNLYIQLSHTENFGNSIIEAASIGLPVLVSETAGAAEYVKKLKAGWVVPLDQKKIVAQIKTAIQTIQEEKFIAVAEKIREEFSGKILAEKYLAEYQNTLAKK